MMERVLINLKDVCRKYHPPGGKPVDALVNVNLQISQEDFVAITGPSGCGKSTLLHLLGALDTPTSGEVEVGGLALHALDEKRKTRYRREEVGIVFQFFNLLPTMTVLENVALPLLLQGVRGAEAHRAAGESLSLVGMGHRQGHFPHQLSGGEMQRAAVARALVHRPRLLIADEPTGNLDRRNADHVLELLKSIHDQAVTTLVVVTHSPEVAAAASTHVRMEDGAIVS